MCSDKNNQGNSWEGQQLCIQTLCHAWVFYYCKIFCFAFLIQGHSGHFQAMWALALLVCEQRPHLKHKLLSRLTCQALSRKTRLKSSKVIGRKERAHIQGKVTLGSRLSMILRFQKLLWIGKEVVGHRVKRPKCVCVFFFFFQFSSSSHGSTLEWEHLEQPCLCRRVIFGTVN